MLITQLMSTKEDYSYTKKKKMFNSYLLKPNGDKYPGYKAVWIILILQV